MPTPTTQVRFGHAPTSGFTRLPSVGGPGGGLPPGPGRNAALDHHGLSPGMSPAMGGGASNMEMSRAMAARSASGLTPSLTPGLSGSLSGLGVRRAEPCVVAACAECEIAARFRCGASCDAGRHHFGARGRCQFAISNTNTDPTPAFWLHSHLADADCTTVTCRHRSRYILHNVRSDALHPRHR